MEAGRRRVQGLGGENFVEFRFLLNCVRQKRREKKTDKKERVLAFGGVFGAELEEERRKRNTNKKTSSAFSSPLLHPALLFHKSDFAVLPHDERGWFFTFFFLGVCDFCFLHFEKRKKKGVCHFRLAEFRP